MRRALLFIAVLFISFANMANAITFNRINETLTFNLSYNGENDIWLSIHHIDSSIEVNTIYFWLNERVDLGQRYISAICDEKSYHKGVYLFRLSQDNFNDIAYNLHSISIGNKWKIVPQKNAGKVREYFINKLLEYKDKKCLDLTYTIDSLKSENERLNEVNKNLLITNDQYLKELEEIKEKYNEIINNITPKSTNDHLLKEIEETKEEIKDEINHIYQNTTHNSTTNKTPSYTYERTTESERVYPPRGRDGKPMYKYKYKYWRNGKWRYRY